MHPACSLQPCATLCNPVHPQVRWRPLPAPVLPDSKCDGQVDRPVQDGPYNPLQNPLQPLTTPYNPLAALYDLCSPLQPLTTPHSPLAAPHNPMRTFAPPLQPPANPLTPLFAHPTAATRQLSACCLTSPRPSAAPRPRSECCWPAYKAYKAAHAWSHHQSQASRAKQSLAPAERSAAPGSQSLRTRRGRENSACCISLLELYCVRRLGHRAAGVVVPRPCRLYPFKRRSVVASFVFLGTRHVL